jgi:hemophore-related protein
MVALPLAKAVGVLVVSLTAGAGIASAGPGLDPMISTNCNFWQLRAAMYAQSPRAAEQFTHSAAEQAWLHDFLASPTPIRQQMVVDAQIAPIQQPYLRVIQQAATICRYY